MRAFPILLALCLAALLLPRPVGAASCDEALSDCYRATVLLTAPESYDLVGCQVDYIACFGRALRFY